MKIEIATNLSKLPKDIENWNKQRKRAMSIGINWTAFDVREHLQGRMKKVFDRPTPYTLRGMLVRRATPDDFDAHVFLRDEAFKGTAPGKYLDPHIEGGRRSQKRAESLLIQKGFMKSGQWLVISKHAKTNQYGNLSGAVVSKALSDIGGQLDMYQRTRQRKRKYFWRVETETAPAGIYFHRAGREVPLMVVVDTTPMYRKRFNFYGDARKHTDMILGKRIDKALARYVD